MLEIALLGEPVVRRAGEVVPLPASRKARGLLAYLVATQKPHRRERLCDLLWEGPDDPRAALRWSLSKLRPLVEPHLVADRDHVEMRTQGARVDLFELSPPATCTTTRLLESAALFRGQFLDGLDLPHCFRFQQWCVAERERLRQVEVAILAELVSRQGASGEGLVHARRRVVVDPFSEVAHASLVRLLAQAGQNREALTQYEQCRSLFERELGVAPGSLVEDARRAIGRTVMAAPAPAPLPSEAALPLVGRAAELHALEAKDTVLLLGEPGLGKSRLLEEVRARTGGVVLFARALAAERVRPYGVWMDGLRALGRDLPREIDRTRLFDAVAEVVADVTLLVLDDVQWLDEASAALLHYVARGAHPPRILCAARVGEIEDNPHMARVLRELSRERRLLKLRLAPLPPEDTAALAISVAPLSDVARVVGMSGGNPLYAIECARALAGGGGDAMPETLTALIAARLDQIDPGPRQLLGWAAVLGHRFDVDVLARATALPAGEMLAGLERLERCAVVRAVGPQTYDFTHDLLRDVAYQAVSGPRRSLAHRQVAVALLATHDPDGVLAGDILHHAALGGDLRTAAEAAVRAGERCLRLFAYAEAMSVARRGLQVLEALGPDPDLEIGLLHVIVMARTPLEERLALVGGLDEACERARRAGRLQAAAMGAHLRAVLSEEGQHYSVAARATLHSAELARGADPATAGLSIATTARCLVFLQKEIGRAEALLAEAQALGDESTELALGLGYLHAHHGRSAEAGPHLEQALVRATRAQDHWREWLALSRLAALALEEGDPHLALRHCARLRPVSEKMEGGSEAVRGEMLETLALHAAAEPADVEGMLVRLRRAESSTDLAWALTLLAERERERGDLERARGYAEEALAAADRVGRRSEAVIARAILSFLTPVAPPTALPAMPAAVSTAVPTALPTEDSADLTARARRFLTRRT